MKMYNHILIIIRVSYLVAHFKKKEKIIFFQKKKLRDSSQYFIEDAAIVEQHYIIDPWMDESLRKDYDGLIRFLELFNKCGELCKKSGL